jgi:hypothetical protein
MFICRFAEVLNQININIMNKYEDGQAFPTLFYNQQTGNPSGHDAGMSLRDYFAAKAISGIMAGQYFGSASVEYYAEVAYSIADAMLIARKQVKTK